MEVVDVAGGVPADEGGKLDFKVDLGDPPTCNVGFLPVTEIRSPADETLRDLPTDMSCKAAQNEIKAFLVNIETPQIKKRNAIVRGGPLSNCVIPPLFVDSDRSGEHRACADGNSLPNGRRRIT